MPHIDAYPEITRLDEAHADILDAFEQGYPVPNRPDDLSKKTWGKLIHIVARETNIPYRYDHSKNPPQVIPGR